MSVDLRGYIAMPGPKNQPDYRRPVWTCGHEHPTRGEAIECLRQQRGGAEKMTDAQRIAAGLMQRLKAGELEKIGIGEVFAAIDASDWIGRWQDRERLAKLVVRELVDTVG